MSEYKDFSSLPPEQERSFAVFEQASIENGKKARIISYIACAAFLAVVLGIVFSFEPPPPKMSEEDLGGLQQAAKKEKPEAAAEAPAEESAADEGADDGAEEAAEDGAEEAAAAEDEAEGDE